MHLVSIYRFVSLIKASFSDIKDHSILHDATVYVYRRSSKITADWRRKIDISFAHCRFVELRQLLGYRYRPHQSI